MLVVGLPLRFRDNVLGLTLSLLVPNLAAAAGWLPGFSVVRFNTLLLPAGALSLYSTWAFDRLYRRLVRYQYDMEALAGEDALTGLPNRRQFMKAGEQMLEQVRRYGRAASLLLMFQVASAAAGDGRPGLVALAGDGDRRPSSFCAARGDACECRMSLEMRR